MSTNNYGDNAFAPGMVSDAYLPDQLIAGDMKIVTDTVTIISGAGALKRGTVLGAILTGAATAAAKAGGNTGNGTISAVTITNPDKAGVYTVRFTAATAFTVEDPDGFVLGNGSTGTAFADDIGFTITAGGTAFVAGDGFDITVVAGSGKYKTATGAATDGSQVVSCILADDVDATAADQLAGVYLTGEFNSNALILGSGLTLAAIKPVLRDAGIFLKTPVSAADPT